MRLAVILGLYLHPQSVLPPGVELLPMRGFKLQDCKGLR